MRKYTKTINEMIAALESLKKKPQSLTSIRLSIKVEDPTMMPVDGMLLELTSIEYWICRK